MKKSRALFGAALLVLSVGSVMGQTKAEAEDPLIKSVRDAAAYARDVFTKAADQMSEEDYAFKPTPEVRSFGALLAHVADTNYWFCSTAMGVKPPVTGLEKSATTKVAINKALGESFAYCEQAYSALDDPEKAHRSVDLMGTERPAVAVLIFRTHHAMLHYGNAITYMRLRGKVPPSSQSPEN